MNLVRLTTRDSSTLVELVYLDVCESSGNARSTTSYDVHGLGTDAADLVLQHRRRGGRCIGFLVGGNRSSRADVKPVDAGEVHDGGGVARDGRLPHRPHMPPAARCQISTTASATFSLWQLASRRADCKGSGPSSYGVPTQSQPQWAT